MFFVARYCVMRDVCGQAVFSLLPVVSRGVIQKLLGMFQSSLGLTPQLLPLCSDVLLPASVVKVCS